MKDIFSHFFIGLTKPSLKVFGSSVVCFLTIVMAAGTFLPKRLLSRVPLERLLVGNHDQVTEAVYRLKRLQTDPPRKALYLFGGSSLREALISPESLAGRLDGRPTVAVFGTRNQSFNEARLLFAQLPDLPPGGEAKVIIGLNPWRFSLPLLTVSQERKGYWFLSQGSVAFDGVKDLALFGAYYWRAHRNDLKRFRLPWAEFRYHLYDEKPPLNAKERMALLERLREKRASFFEERFEFHAETLVRFLREIRQRGYSPILVEVPSHSENRTAFRDLFKVYQHKIQDLSRSEQVAYFPLGVSDWLKAEDFYDLAHLLPTGRQKFETALASLFLDKGDTS